jgi:hypothetical protein
MVKQVAKFGTTDTAIVLCGLLLAGYFATVLPLLPQNTEQLAGAAPLVMGIGLMIAIIGLVLSFTAIALVIKDSVKNHPVNVSRLVLGIVGIALFGFFTLAIILVTTAFVLGLAGLRR